MKNIQFIKPLHLNLKKYLFLKPTTNKVVSVFLIVNTNIIYNDFLKGYFLLLNKNNEIPHVNKVFDNYHLDKYCKIDLKLQNFKIIQKNRLTKGDNDFIIYFILGNSNRCNFWLDKQTDYIWRDHYFIPSVSTTIDYTIDNMNINNHNILNMLETNLNNVYII
jgi:hypothetical protein